MPYGANMGYSHQPNYYNNYGVSNTYGAGFQQPAAGYSGYGVGSLCFTFTMQRCLKGSWANVAFDIQ